MAGDMNDLAKKFMKWSAIAALFFGLISGG